jgi:hypothetical protein
MSASPVLSPAPASNSRNRSQNSWIADGALSAGGAASVELTRDDLHRIDEAASKIEVQCARYSEGAQRWINR